MERFKILLENNDRAYLDMLDAVARVSMCLRDAGVEHATFKTIRPYKSTTVDIDTVAFGNPDDYHKALRTMKKMKYSMLAEGPMSATFWDEKANIGVDIYNEIAVSALCYLDKDKLCRFSSNKTLPNGTEANILEPEADLLAIIAHSIVKEQMYTLSEYYSFVKYLENLKVDVFIDLVKETNLTHATKTHGSITALLFQTTHGSIPEKLEEILEVLGQDNFETSRILNRGFETPHKYHPITIAKSLLEITKGEKTRNSIATQFRRMINPTFTARFLSALLQHVFRETY